MESVPGAVATGSLIRESAFTGRFIETLQKTLQPCQNYQLILPTLFVRLDLMRTTQWNRSLAATRGERFIPSWHGM